MTDAPTFQTELERTLYEALRSLDQIERGLVGWHEDARAEAWGRARAALAKAESRP